MRCVRGIGLVLVDKRRSEIVRLLGCPSQHHVVGAAAFDIERVIRCKRNIDLVVATLLDKVKAVVEAIEGPLNMTECSGEHSNCEHEAHCGVQTHWRRINDVIAEALGGITLAEMLPPAAARKAIPMTLANAPAGG